MGAGLILGNFFFNEFLVVDISLWRIFETCRRYMTCFQMNPLIYIKRVVCVMLTLYIYIYIYVRQPHQTGDMSRCTISYESRSKL